MDLFQGVFPPITLGLDAKPEAVPLLERLDHYGVPTVSVAVIDGGELRFAKTWSRLDAADSPTPEFAFQAGSLSKLLAGTVALRFGREGSLDLDRSLVEQFPELSELLDSPVTLRQVLSHTGGLSPASYPGYEQGTPMPTLDQILSGISPSRSPALSQVEPPGEIWRYSGGGYELVEKVLEIATGKAYQDLVNEEIFTPLEMTGSSFLAPLDESRATRGHAQDGTPLDFGWKVYPQRAAAGLWTTPQDLANWIIDVQKAYAGKPARRLHKSIAREMVKAQEPGNWGIGPKLGGEGHASWFAHAGASEGYRAFAVGFISSGHGAVVMTNGDRGGPLIREVLAGLATIYDWPTFQPQVRASSPRDTAALESIAGTFALREAAGQRAEIRAVDGTLEMSLFGGTSLLHSEDPNGFFDLVEGWEVEVETRSDDDRAQTLRITTFPSLVFTAQRVEEGVDSGAI